MIFKEFDEKTWFLKLIVDDILDPVINLNRQNMKGGGAPAGP